MQGRFFSTPSDKTLKWNANFPMLDVFNLPDSEKELNTKEIAKVKTTTCTYSMSTVGYFYRLFMAVRGST